MRPPLRFGLSTLVVLSCCVSLFAQGTQPAVQTQPPAPVPAPTPVPQPPPPPAATVVAATVNTQKIMEIAVYRALMRVDPREWDKVRPEVINFLIENALIDQYLEQLKVAVDGKEIEQRVAQIRQELDKQPKQMKLEDMLAKLFLTEQELRTQIYGALRWDKFVDTQAPDATLLDMFTKNKVMFDSTLVRAKHILIKLEKTNDPAAAQQATAKLALLKQQILTLAAAELAKVPAQPDKVAQEKARLKALEDAFAAYAQRDSGCPSKQQGGELGFFPRIGRMVEPFSRVAFALKPGDISDPVSTEFGAHIILSLDVKPGKDVKFEEVRELVKEVYAERLREAVLQQMRPRSQIQIAQAAPAAVPTAVAPPK